MTAAISNRNVAETEVPITPPIAWNASRRSRIATVVVATASDASTTIVECPSEKYNPAATGRLAVAHQLAHDVIDRRDMIRVHRVPQSEHPREQRGPQQCRLPPAKAWPAHAQAMRLAATRGRKSPLNRRHRLAHGLSFRGSNAIIPLREFLL